MGHGRTQRGDSGTHQVKAIEIKEGNIWTRDTLRQLQSDWICKVPKVIQAAIKAYNYQ
jgi:hypothetical protein